MNIITENKVRLLQWLRGDDFLLQHVQSKRLITSNEYVTLDGISDSNQKITKLLDLMLKKGDKICTDFLNLLKEDHVNESMPELRDWIATINTSSASSASTMSSSLAQAGRQNVKDNQAFFKKNRSALIQKVKNVSEIIDELNYSDEQMSKLDAKGTEQEKMRMILSYTTSKKAADLLMQALLTYEADVMEELA